MGSLVSFYGILTGLWAMPAVVFAVPPDAVKAISLAFALVNQFPAAEGVYDKFLQFQCVEGIGIVAVLQAVHAL